MRLRHRRGAERVQAMGADPADPESILRTALDRAGDRLPLPPLRLEWSERPSLARPGARGRYLAGVITLFPAALADPLTLAWTALHELGHAAGLDERAADAFASSILHGGPS